MLRNLLLPRLLPAVVIATALVVLPLEILTEAQQQTPAGPAPAATGRRAGGDESSRDRSQVEGRQPVRELGGAR